MSEPAFVAETLAWCNGIRKQKGQDPLNRLPKGTRIHGDSCPCGAATGAWVGRTKVWLNGEPTGKADGDLPLAVKEFVVAFDKGELPQYDETLSESEYFDAEGNGGTLDEVHS